jgi:hypothetical protein
MNTIGEEAVTEKKVFGAGSLKIEENHHADGTPNVERDERFFETQTRRKFFGDTQ